MESDHQNNQVVVFFVDKNDWVSVYDLGSAHVKDMSFDRNNNLVLTVTNGAITEKKQIFTPVIADHFNNLNPVTKKLQFSKSFPKNSVFQ